MNAVEAQALVLDALTKASSQDASQLKPAEHQLKQWETEPGFYSILVTIFSSHNIDVNVRWLAVLYFKNGVDRYWRRSAPFAISEEEKAQLRTRLLSNFNEPYPQVATQLAVLIGKVARLDCPRQWPDLIPTLLTALQRDEQLLRHRALLVLYHVTKTLASKRLAADKKLFQELTSEILGFVLHLWNNYTELFYQRLSEGDASAVQALEQSTLSLKVARKLVVYGLKEPDSMPDVVQFISSTFGRLKSLLVSRKQLQGDSHCRELCEKHIGFLMKLLLDTQEQHPFSYVSFIYPSLEFIVTYLFTEAGDGLLFDRFVVQNLNLLKVIITCSEYRPSKKLEETKNAMTLKAHEVKMSFFSTQTLMEMCKRLLSRYFLLTAEDLAAWETDPEGFAVDEGGEAWRYSLKPCTEVLFIGMFREFKSTLIPTLLDMVSHLQDPCDYNDLNTLLQKDAVYTAVGLASFELFDEIDYDHWFTTYLLSELQIQNPLYKIVRRRVTWLLGQWVGVKMAVELRPALYECLQPLLRHEEDLVVRLTAANTLRDAIDEFEFNVEQFLPYLESSFALLFQLLKDVSECDTKMLVLHVLSIMIERCGSNIRPYVSTLLQYLPLLWEQSVEHNMLRCAILTTLVHVVQGLGSTSEQLYNFLLPVIQFSTDTSQEPHIYLMEDGLELWLITLQNASRITPGLLRLFQNMGPLLDLGSENLKTCFCIIATYVLLGPQEFLQKYAADVARMCLDMYSDMRPEGIIMILRMVELMLRTYPVEGPHLLKELLPRVVGNIFEYETNPMLLSIIYAVLARVVVQSTDVFLLVLQQVVKENTQQVEELFREVLRIWIDRINCITQPERRKICGLALANLLTCNSRVVLEKFPDMMIVIVEILHDVCREENGSQTDSLIYTCLDDIEEDDLDTEHDKRKRMLCLQDPVHTVSLREFVMLQLNNCQRIHGNETFNKLMASVDAEVTSQLQEFMKP